MASMTVQTKDVPEVDSCLCFERELAFLPFSLLQHARTHAFDSV